MDKIRAEFNSVKKDEKAIHLTGKIPGPHSLQRQNKSQMDLIFKYGK